MPGAHVKLMLHVDHRVRLYRRIGRSRVSRAQLTCPCVEQLTTWSSSVSKGSSIVLRESPRNCVGGLTGGIKSVACKKHTQLCVSCWQCVLSCLSCSFSFQL
jgi:hypothetical protein